MSRIGYSSYITILCKVNVSEGKRANRNMRSFLCPFKYTELWTTHPFAAIQKGTINLISSNNIK